jgi:hypothetical protein
MSIVEDPYAKTLDDLPLNELNDDEDFQSTLHRTETAAPVVRHSQEPILIEDIRQETSVGASTVESRFCGL